MKTISFDEVFQKAYDMNVDDSCKNRYESSKCLAVDIWDHQQSKIDELQARIDDLQAHSLMLREAANSWTYSEGEKNILISQADDLDRILKGNKDD